MRERSDDGSVNEIDTFMIRFTFPPGAQNQEYIGERQAATVTLSADITCIEPNVCGPFPSLSELPSGQTILEQFLAGAHEPYTVKWRSI